MFIEVLAGWSMCGMKQQTRVHNLMVDGLIRLTDRVLMSEPYYPGLEGVIAGETSVSTIDGGLQYRGYHIDDLAAHATFLETAYLLLKGELPTQEELADFQSVMLESSEIPRELLEFLRAIPLNAPLMDVLRTAVSAAAHFDPQPEDTGSDVDLNRAVRLLAQIPIIISARYRLTCGLEPLPPRPELGYAANWLYMITGEEPEPVKERAMDVSLILYAEHEFNASTFTARVVTSTGSDLYSAITAAIGALKGPLHGGANERVMAVLQSVGSPEHADAWIRDALARKSRVMGFGHRVYKGGDPRARILKEFCRELAELAGNTDLEETADVIEDVMWQEKQLPPNLDWPSARLYHYLGLEVELYTPLFVASRVAGWSAHVIEQAENNRLIRPRSQYIGPEPRRFKPLSER